MKPKRIRFLVMGAAVCVLVLAAVGWFALPQSRNNALIYSMEQLNSPEYKIVVQTGTSGMGAREKVFPKSTPVFMQSALTDNCLQVITRRADAFLSDKPTLEYAALNRPELTVFPEPAAEGHLVIGAALGNEKLIEQVNQFIRKCRQEGLYDDMYKRWLLTKNPKLPDDLPKAANPDGKLVIGTEGLNEPFTFVGPNNQLTGYDVEFALRLGAYLNKEIELQAIPWDPLILATQAGKVDLMVSELDDIPENRETMCLSEDYVASALSLLVRKDRLAPEVLERIRQKTDANAISAGTLDQTTETGTSWERLKRRFYRTLIQEDRWMMVLKGLGMTLMLTFCSVVLGTLLGFLLCLVRRSHSFIPVTLAKILIRFIQGTPLLVFLMVLYYIVFGQVNISAVLVAIFAFSINLAVYFAESLRGGIDAIDRGQIEAAKAMGFSRFQRFRLIVFPQVVRIIMPVYKGEIVSLLKETAIVGYIAIEDLTKMSDIIRSRTYDAFFPLIMTTIIYLIVAYGLIFLMTFLERRTDPKLRPRRLKGVVETI